MKELTPKQKKRANQIIDVIQHGTAGIAKMILDLEDKIDEELPNVMNIVNKLKGEKGDNYVLTDEDKKNIASVVYSEFDKEEIAKIAVENIDKNEIAKMAAKYIDVPVVEKVIERTKTIVEQPIYNETIREGETIVNHVENEDTGQEIIDKINLDKNSLIKSAKIEGLDNFKEDIKTLKERPININTGFKSFRNLTDAPHSYKDQANKIVSVKADETGLEFTDNTGGGGTWGSITGTLSDQTDLQSALNAKQNNITLGTTAQYFRGDLSLATFPTDNTSFTNGAGYITGISGLDHNSLGNLTVGDAHTQYALLAGRSGGQTLIGGTASGNNLTLRSTSNATKGSIIMGTTYYDEVNNRLGINNSTPFASLTVTGTTSTTSRIGWSFSNTYGQTYLQAAFSSISQNGNTFEGYINQIGGTGSQWLNVLGNLSVQFFNNVTTSGVFYAGTGSATFPSLSFGSDSNTGIYRSAIDTVAFATGGTFRGSINSAGTLTIGAGTVAAIPQNTSTTFVPSIGAFTTSGSAGISAGVTDGTNNRRAGLFVNQTDGLWGLSHSYSSGRIPFVIVSNTTEQFRIDTSHRVGIGESSPTAWLHLKAGISTAGFAPLKFNSGTNLTTAENGAMEYNGTNLFFTRTGAVRENILMSSAVTTESVVSDTTVTVNIGGTNYKLLARA